MSSYSASAATRRGSFVPPLVGIDDNVAGPSVGALPPGSVDSTPVNFNPKYSVKGIATGDSEPFSGELKDPSSQAEANTEPTTTSSSSSSSIETYDVMICGTGLPESILAAALAWQGSTVLHIDANPYYGDYNAILNTDSIQTWVNTVNNEPKAHKLGPHGTFCDAQLYIPRPLVSRHYLIDLTPKIIFAKSDLLALLLKSRVSTYLEFKALGTFHTFENDCFEKVPGTKEDIFTDQSLSLLTKRALMKFMKFVIDWEPQYSLWGPYRKRPIRDFLREAFKLPEAQIVEIGHTIGLCSTLQVPTMVGLARIKRYLASLEVYGNFPVLYSMYGSAGEISQGFCRSAAVAGATYKLQCGLSSLSASKQSDNDNDVISATLTDGTQVKITEKIVASPTNLPATVGTTSAPTQPISRLVAIVGKSCEEWFAPQETAAIVVFPVDSLATHNTHAVQCLVMGSGSGTCPEGQAIWYLASSCPDTIRARADLDEALKKLEMSILRESMDNIQINVGEGDIKFREGDGMPLLSSVRLGASLHEFVPKEKLKYILKLRYTQLTTAGSEEVLLAPVHPLVTKGENGEVLTDVLMSNASTAEISYDGTVAEARRLYTAIVGADDDFFQVDFEDDEDIDDVDGDNEIDSSSDIAINVVNADESPKVGMVTTPASSQSATQSSINSPTIITPPAQAITSKLTSDSTQHIDKVADSKNSNGNTTAIVDPDDPLHPGIHYSNANSNINQNYINLGRNTSAPANNSAVSSRGSSGSGSSGSGSSGNIGNNQQPPYRHEKYEPTHHHTHHHHHHHHPHDDSHDSHDHHDHHDDYDEELDTHVPDFGDDMEL
ncbi:FAD/NAD(P)-binding domain-containing protein [Nadsonia fulvescens var. elongata DSM 6958]|uniref:Rab proteins geranylgeranyltransferase component A n=1 Tax=Nadsonia fulvescens var. elongata DSM 6958 TaxID=857566 RepID=A0A1E3PH10_9ASCO|nr:FAD/NAD(P)-binding domain-containing protein [Nadsonia fulvescens var. elongata DSM 6958]